MERKYSIVLTAYNAELYLRQCLESIGAQTYMNWELIVVNDGSIDGSGTIAREFTDTINADDSLRSVVYLEHENKGAVFSRERGICNATGDYLLFIDSDDYYDSDLLEKVDETIKKTNADIIQFGYKFIDKAGEETTDCGLSKKGGIGDKEIVVENDNNSFSYKALTTCYSLWSRAFKKTLFDTREGFYQDYYDVNMTNDLLAFSRPLSLAKTYCFTDFYLYNYRILESSLCHKLSIQKICSYFRSLGWAEQCLRNTNGVTDEHIEFFSRRLTNIVFDEYREYIYTSCGKDIKSVYRASNAVKDSSSYLTESYRIETDWYKRLFILSFMKKWIVIPKLLMIYTNIKNRI